MPLPDENALAGAIVDAEKASRRQSRRAPLVERAVGHALLLYLNQGEGKERRARTQRSSLFYAVCGLGFVEFRVYDI